MDESTGNGAAGQESSGSFDDGSSSSTQTVERSGAERPVPGQPPGSSQDSQANETQGDGSGNGRQGESRYERTKRERREFKAAQEAFARERQAFAQERAQFEESKKPKRNYTLTELKHYRNEWAREAQQGDYDKAELVQRADQEIANMEAEERASRQTLDLPRYGTPEHQKIWLQSEAEIRQGDPDFGIQGTPIDQKMRALLNGPHAQLYRDHPYGVFAAYSEAQKLLLKDQNQVLSQENQSLKQELQRITGRTSISGGVPGRMGGEPKEFSKLSSAEMRKRLLATRDRPDSSMPWL